VLWKKKPPSNPGETALGDNDFTSKAERAIYEQFIELWKVIGELKGGQRFSLVFLTAIMTILALILNKVY